MSPQNRPDFDGNSHPAGTDADDEPRPGKALESRAWNRSRDRAGSVAGDAGRLSDLGDSAESHLSGKALGKLESLIEDVKALIRLVRAYAKNEYRDIAFDNLVLIVAGLVYLATPIDLIPDFLGPIGFADDAVVLRFVLRTVGDEIEQFRQWEATRP